MGRLHSPTLPKHHICEFLTTIFYIKYLTNHDNYLIMVQQNFTLTNYQKPLYWHLISSLRL